MGNTQSSVKLTYFDIKGLGEAIRLALEIGGIPYEDNRIKFSEWKELKPTTPYGSLPVLEVNGEVYAQSEPILRFVGKKGGLYPSDELKALKVDEIMAAVQDTHSAIAASVHEKDEAKKAGMRKALASETLPMWFDNFAKIIEANGSSGFTFGDSVTVADLKLYGTLVWIRSGILDGIPKSVVEDRPALVRLMTLVEAHPKVQAYQKARAEVEKSKATGA